MNVGKMDRKITIEKYTTSRSASGEQTESWETLSTVWAQLRYKRAVEVEENNELVAVRTATWIIRYLSTVNETMRISYNSEYYYITGVKIYGRNEYMELETELRDA